MSPRRAAHEAAPLGAALGAGAPRPGSAEVSSPNRRIPGPGPESAGTVPGVAPPSQPEPDVEALLAHSRYVRALARELVFDAALARDVEQETWLAALDQAPRDPRALRGWLAALVRNIALKAWRSADRRRNRELEHARVERGAPTPADVAEREELRRRLVEAVNSLEEPYRSVLVLRFLEGLEPPAVARRLEVSLETVRTRQKRALERLRARLDRASHGEIGRAHV